ncbi:hypothetical protein E2C01_091610 [Portunus trituberculatus]|uniref:Uncharacterized protein n=1 Tax=Portunus trituberculatus TaxID=210409 RepID=A0A5B7JVH7_PORTR|nr:hypothetical protein [Portunus trituberculatus]
MPFLTSDCDQDLNPCA